MNKRQNLFCAFLISGALLFTGCGGGNSNTTTFADIYKAAGIEEAYITAYERASIDTVDDLLVHRKYSVDRSISIQKAIDKGNTHLYAFLRDNMYYQLGKSGTKARPIEYREKTGYVYHDRPIRFYLLKPDSEGKFGDHSSAILEEVKFAPPKDEKGETNLELLGMNRHISVDTMDSVWPRTTYYDGLSWEITGQLWTNKGVYLVTDYREDKKNHDCICIIAKPGDIATGIENETFPFKEDLAYELLGSYIGFLDWAIDTLPLEMPEKTESELAAEENRPPYYGPERINLDSFGNVELIMHSIKKLESTDTYAAYTANLIYYMGTYSGKGPQPIYVRIHKDGKKEISLDNQQFYEIKSSIIDDSWRIWDRLCGEITQYLGVTK